MTRFPISSRARLLLSALIAAAILGGFSPRLSKAEELAPDPAKIRDHVAYLASDDLGGRDSGEPGLEIAAEYLARFYAEYGLEPAGDNGTYFQHFTIPQGACFVQDAGAVIEFEKGGEISWTPDAEVAAFGFTDGKTIEAPLAFAGYGITTNEKEKSRGLEYDDYSGLDVKGKVVIILRYTPRYSAADTPFGGRRSRHAPFAAKIDNARKNGAVGVIFVTPTGRPDQDCYGVVHRAAPVVAGLVDLVGHHPLCEQRIERLDRAGRQVPGEVHRTGEEAGIQQVKDRVFDTADVLIDRKPVGGIFGFDRPLRARRVYDQGRRRHPAGGGGRTHRSHRSARVRRRRVVSRFRCAGQILSE